MRQFWREGKNTVIGWCDAAGDEAAGDCDVITS
jgi:hypothetical protein